MLSHGLKQGEKVLKDSGIYPKQSFILLTYVIVLMLGMQTVMSIF